MTISLRAVKVKARRHYAKSADISYVLLMVTFGSYMMPDSNVNLAAIRDSLETRSTK